jgi:acetyltransferase
VPTFDYPEEAVRSFKKLIDYQMKVKSLRAYQVPKTKVKPTLEGVSSVKDVTIKKFPVISVASKAVDYLSAFAELKKYDIPVVKTVRYSSSRLASYKYPAVLKITGPDFSHKTDRGGVVVNLKTPADLRAAAEKMAAINKIGLKNPQNYLVVQEQAAKFQEIILGFKRDAAFGPLLMVGQGGIYTEVFKDFKLAISDINKTEALKLIQELKIYPVLNGARGQKKYDLAALAQALVNLARLANEHPEISELDINPLFVFEKGIQAGDVRIIL